MFYTKINFITYDGLTPMIRVRTDAVRLDCAVENFGGNRHVRNALMCNHNICFVWRN